LDGRLLNPVITLGFQHASKKKRWTTWAYGKLSTLADCRGAPLRWGATYLGSYGDLSVGAAEPNNTGQPTNIVDCQAVFTYFWDGHYKKVYNGPGHWQSLVT